MTTQSNDPIRRDAEPDAWGRNVVKLLLGEPLDRPLLLDHFSLWDSELLDDDPGWFTQ